jgi:hypothetical protein
MPSRPALRNGGRILKETAAWQQRTNNKQRGVEWQVRIDDARTKLKSFYPKLLV